MITKIRLMLIFLISMMFFINCGSCSPDKNPKDLLLWSLDFEKDPQYQQYEYAFGDDCAIHDDLLVCERSKYMLGIDKKSGVIKWSYKSEYVFQRTPIIINDKIFNISDYGPINLTVLNLDGNLIYERVYSDYQGNSVDNIPVIVYDKIFYIVKDINYRSTLISINTNTYNLENYYNFNGSNNSRIIYQDNNIYIPYYKPTSTPNNDDRSGVIAYDLLNEEEKWKTSFGELNGISNYNPIIHNGKMYVQVQCYTKELDLETGEVLRTFIESCGNNGMSAVDNILFHPDWLEAFDLNTGKRIWNRYAEFTLDSGSVYHDGVFYVMYYGLTALDAETGEYILEPNTGNWGVGPSWVYDGSAGMPLLDDGVIYINGAGGIHAFNVLDRE